MANLGDGEHAQDIEAMQIIINADDLGMSDGVNAAIFELMSEGRVSSSTVIANAPAVRDAAKSLSRFPHCSFGVHLNLTQFEPLSGREHARHLVDHSGQMSRAIVSLRRLGLPLLRAAYVEWCSQIDRLASLGVPISHFDSHNHVHTQPQFLPVLKAVQRRYGIRRVRISKNLYSREQPCSTGLWWSKKAYNQALRNVYRTLTTDLFTEMNTFERIGKADPDSLRGTIELMVHPGAAYAGPETTLLRSPWMAEVFGAVRLLTYRDLGDH